MSLLPGAKRARFKQERDPDDWYQEPGWCSEQLFETVRFIGPIHDPACGKGRIVNAARRAGYSATGADIIDRGFGEVGIDFLTDERPRKTLVYNAPYKDNEAFIAHSLQVASEAVALIVPIPFLCGQSHFWEIYRPCPPALVLACSERPSMPPGGRGIPEKGGTRDYCWLIWTRHPLARHRSCATEPTGWWRSHHGTIVDWLKPSGALRRAKRST